MFLIFNDIDICGPHLPMNSSLFLNKTWGELGTSLAASVASPRNPPRGLASVVPLRPWTATGSHFKLATAARECKKYRIMFVQGLNMVEICKI